MKRENDVIGAKLDSAEDEDAALLGTCFVNGVRRANSISKGDCRTLAGGEPWEWAPDRREMSAASGERTPRQNRAPLLGSCYVDGVLRAMHVSREDCMCIGEDAVWIPGDVSAESAPDSMAAAAAAADLQGAAVAVPRAREATQLGSCYVNGSLRATKITSSDCERIACGQPWEWVPESAEELATVVREGVARLFADAREGLEEMVTRSGRPEFFADGINRIHVKVGVNILDHVEGTFEIDVEGPTVNVKRPSQQERNH